MSDVAAGIKTAIAADPVLAIMHAQYTFTTGAAAQPAIFDSDDVPPDCPGPYTILVDAGGSNLDMRTDRRFRTLIICSTYGDKKFTIRAQSEIAHRIKRLLHLQKSRVSISGYAVVEIEVDPPRQTKGPNGITGFEENITITLEEV